ncbi:delta-1-Pyrroline-5-carboxylate dehydrogenase 1 [Brevipalpus obovatus]|uniref:delta-1-Pyrroline-5-carboxylate dehydrogenase 1 n=1 Tax=Brevipalpus obovatus TaxID=246614 RepID=UPI003D9F133B
MSLPTKIEKLLSCQIGRNVAQLTRLASTYNPPQLNDFQVKNESFLGYLRGSKERIALDESLKRLSREMLEVPIVINGKEYRSDQSRLQQAPFDHSLKVAKYYWATPNMIREAIQTCNDRREEWERAPLSEKINIFMRAADLVSGKYRSDMLASTMLGQGKTIFQAEIDAAAELADFLRFNAFFAKELYKYQPISDQPNVVRNSMRHRGIEGFIAAISPFNFTAIGGNLASAPALMGNVVIWKPSDTAILSNYIVYKIFHEAGMPPGVINFVPCDGPIFGDIITADPSLAGINFTGSVNTFRFLWSKTAQNLDTYRNYPRLSGECGGKNYHFVHPSADTMNVAVNTVRSAFEYSGQKCSACSRLYVPKSKWPEIKDKISSICDQLKIGSPLDHQTFTSAVIDGKAFNRIRSYLDHASSSKNCEIIRGGQVDESIGFYVQPTIIQVHDPNDRLMKEEIFGPILSVYVYPDSEVKETLKLVQSIDYALTGAIFGQDANFLREATEMMKMSAGNFYINDKSTGAVVGQQPFGGARLSGTNDKPGGPHNLLRWTSPQTIKESFVNQTEWRYPYMME